MVNKSGHVKKLTVTTNDRIQAGFNSVRRKKAKNWTQNQFTNRMHDYQENTNLFGNVQNVLFLLRRTDELFLLWHWLFWVQSNFQVTKNQQKQQKLKKKSLYKEQTFAPREFHSVLVRTLTRQTNAGDIVRGPESETLLPPLGDFCRHVSFQSFTLVGVAVQQHSFPQQRVTGYPHQEVSQPLLKHHCRQK